MPRSREEEALCQQYFQTLLESAVSLQQGPDPEVALEALLDAVQMLQEHLQHQLVELRTEQVE